MAEHVVSVRNYADSPHKRISTGIPSLDMLTEGPAPGEVTVIIGRSFSGKSLFATNIMAHDPQRPTIFFSLEMPARQVLTRLYATWAGVPHIDVIRMVKEGNVPEHFDRLGDAFQAQVVVDTAALSLGDMGVYLQAYEDYFGLRPQLAIIDYLELIGGAKASGEGWVRTEAVAGALKDWAKDEEMPVVALHQTNKLEPEWKPPTADSARGAGFTEADVVAGLWQPSREPGLSADDYDAVKGKVFMSVLKNRITGRVTSSSRPIVLRLQSDLRLVDEAAEQTMEYFNAG